MLNHQKRNDNTHLWVPPLQARLSDFNFLMRQIPCEIFVKSNSQEMVLIFASKCELPGANNTLMQFSLRHTLFLVKERDAVQLEAQSLSAQSGDKFRARCRHPDHSFSLELARDFDTVQVSDSSGRIPVRTFQRTERIYTDLDSIFFNPIPAHPKLIGHHPSIHYVVFTYEPFGSHPSMDGPTSPTTPIRGFRGTPGAWEEFGVSSARISGRGLHNISLETDLGYFFFPGPHSVGPATYTPLGRPARSVELRDFDPDDLMRSDIPHFCPDAARALRSLGLPAQWPPAEFL